MDTRDEKWEAARRGPDGMWEWHQERLRRRFEARFGRGQWPRPLLRLPDLAVVEQAEVNRHRWQPSVFTLSGRDVSAAIWVENLGGAAVTKPFDVYVNATVIDMYDPSYTRHPVANYPLVAHVTSKIPAGGQHSILLQHVIPVPDEMWRVAVFLTVIVDPGTSAKPGGQIWEADETNNAGEYRTVVEV